MHTISWIQRLSTAGWRPAAAGLVLALVGCGMAFEAPPLRVEERESLLGAGRIVRVQNTSDETLTGIRVRITAPSGDERTYTHERLEGYAVFEVGWKKLGGWEVPAASQVEVKCAGFLLSVKAELPESSPDSGEQ
jgi:hypothetical protein